MSTHEKLKERILSPRVPRDISFDELASFLNKEEFILERVRGSHHFFVYKKIINNKSVIIPLIIPYGSPVLKCYILNARNAVKAIEEAKNDGISD